MKGFISGLPKVELHLHIEGTLEPDMLFAFAQKNGISLPFDTVEALREAYQFNDLQSFLDLYYWGAKVLRTEQDFYDLTWAYLAHCHDDHVVHTEIFFDPQSHMQNGVPMATVINGIDRALQDGQAQLGISSGLIMCFLRHLSEDAAMETLRQALPFKDRIIAVGLDSSELGHPPEKFTRVFTMAREAGWLTVAHAGEEGPADNIQGALAHLQVSRIDHGVRCTDDPAVMETLRQRQIPLTVCPLSNVKLGIFDVLTTHNIMQLVAEGLCVTINSDDPAYFGGYMTANFLAVAEAFDVSKVEMAKFTQRAIDASFLSQDEKTVLQARLSNYVEHQFRAII
ncbi:adenosine deaminase [Photobacterium japonica]|uniref:adenosine deaminase n=1 Tax=Photobacterium japonica TaxID=2910235 RepID=UPI003D0CE95A